MKLINVILISQTKDRALLRGLSGGIILMEQKPQIVMEYYDQEERVIEGYMLTTENKKKKFRETGLNIEEFKKSVRKKYGDAVDIVNKIRRNREAPRSDFNPEDPQGAKQKDERFSSQDIRDAMKNKFSD